MSSLCCALQAFSNLNDHACLACGKSTFKTSQGVLKHLSQARGCQWYKKGKLKDLEMDIEVIEELPPNFLPYIPPHAEDEEHPYNVLDQLDHELFDLIPAQPLPSWPSSLQHDEDPVAEPSSPPEGEDSTFTEIYPGAGQVLCASEPLYNLWRREFAPNLEDDVEMAGPDQTMLPDPKYAPFASSIDWSIACWAIEEGIGQNSLNRLLDISGVHSHSMFWVK